MKKVYLSAPFEIETIETEKPTASDEYGVVVRVLATGICATDVHSYLGETIHGNHFPFHIGHEIAGVVDSCGHKVSLVKPGDTVVLNPLIYCGECEECLSGHWNFCSNIRALGITGPGGFSDFVYTLETNVAKFNSASAYEMTFAEPLSTVLHAIDLAGSLTNNKILIQGAGTLGLLFLKVLAVRHKYCSVTVSDPDRGRHRLIQENQGIAQTPDQLASQSYDVIFDCTGNALAVQNALELLKNHGTLILFGVCPHDSAITVNPFKIYRHEVTIKGAYALNNNIEEAAKMLDLKQIEVMDLVSGIICGKELSSTLKDLSSRKLVGKYIVEA